MESGPPVQSNASHSQARSLPVVKWVFIAIAVGIVLWFFSVVTTPKIVGTWTARGVWADSTIVFNRNGKIFAPGESGTWEDKGGLIRIKTNAQTAYWKVSDTGDGKTLQVENVNEQGQPTGGGTILTRK